MDAYWQSQVWVLPPLQPKDRLQKSNCTPRKRGSNKSTQKSGSKRTRGASVPKQMQEISSGITKEELSLRFAEQRAELKKELLQERQAMQMIGIQKSAEAQFASPTRPPTSIPGTLDAGGVTLALRLQAPLINLLSGKNAHTNTSTHPREDMSLRSAQEEYDIILQGYDRNHELYGLTWIDFIQSDAEELQEIVSLARGMAHKRVLKRLYKYGQAGH